MAAERTVRREVTSQTVQPAEVTETTVTPERVTEERVVETTTVPATPPPAKPTATNVNVAQDPASGNVSIATPDGVQVNVNT